MPRKTDILKPCPFCGKTPTAERNKYGSWEVGCSCELGPMTDLYGERLHAIRAWNRRANSTASKPMRCENCRWWDAEHGECHRHAPSVLPALDPRDGLVSAWPPTTMTDWCGEFEPRTEAGGDGR